VKLSSGSPLLRVSAALQAALLLSIQLVDGSGLHRCPDHDAGVGTLVVEAPAAHEHHHQDHGAPGRHEGLCPCLGTCHQGTVALAPVGTAAIVLAPAYADEAVPRPSAAFRSQLPHLLPFALGPPLRA
jgi:hypothetical protein